MANRNNGLLNKNKQQPGRPNAKGRGGRDKATGAKPPPAYVPGQQSYEGLNADQNRVINQTMQGDVALGDTANAQLGGINNAYSQPYDWNQLPTAPWAQGQDVRGMANQYQDQVYQNFARNADPEFERQLESFDQMMANRGIPMGSDLYNKQRKALLDTQEGQRQQIRTDALTGSDAYATNWNNLGTQNYQNAYTMSQARRDMPLADYNKLRGAMSPYGTAALGYSQSMGLQNDQQAADRWMMQNQPRGGAGGGGGAPTAWQKAGYGTYQEMIADEEARRRANQQWDWQNNPQYRQPSGPSYGAQIGGQILGTGLGLLTSYGMNNWM